MKDNLNGGKINRCLSRREKVNSILFAVFISETLICSMVGRIVRIPNLSVIVSILLLLGVFLNNGTISGRIIPPMFAAATVSLLLIISMFLNGTDRIATYFVYFICFGVTSIFFVSTKYNIEYIFKTLIRIYIFYLVFYLLFIRRIFLSSETYWSEQMGRAYGFVPIIIVAFVMILYRKFFHIRIYEKTAIIAMGLLAFIFLAFDCGTRGALVAVAFSFFILLVAKEKNAKRIALIFGGAIAAFLLINYYREILQFIHSILTAQGIKIVALDKMIMMLKTSGADNGRNVLYESASQYFFTSPMIGHGIGYFEKMQNTYVHNIFLEILCEYGILGLLSASVIIIANFRALMKGKINQTKILGLLLFCISMPTLFFSNTYWMLPQFWIYFFWTISKYKEMRKKNIARYPEKCVVRN